MFIALKLTGLCRPLTTLTFRANRWLSSTFDSTGTTTQAGSPWGYHIGNVFMHAAVCGLVVLVCCEVVFSAKIPANRTTCASESVELSMLTAMLFAAHPIHTEAVSGLVGRAEILSAFFFMLALLSYAKCKRMAHNASTKAGGTLVYMFWFGCSSGNRLFG